MPGIFEGYSYDIFISYRQKDNKGDRWVSEFVEALKTELESTFKEEISVYFDINPHDGLLEIHDVSASLKEKLKCLIFIPILSRTYCDPKSFAWEYEFKAFVEQAKQDQFGLRVKLPDGNIAARVLPVRIHELDQEDADLCGSVLGGFLRGIEFIYKEPGVNRPLTPYDDENKNLNKTRYRNQINKVANAVKEIIRGLKESNKTGSLKVSDSAIYGEKTGIETNILPGKKPGILNKRKILSGALFLAILSALFVFFIYPRPLRKNILEDKVQSGDKISIAVYPFRDLTNDSTYSTWPLSVQFNLKHYLSNSRELILLEEETINELLNRSGIVNYASISPSLARIVARKLEADVLIYGTIQKNGNIVQAIAQLIETKSNQILKSFEVKKTYNEGIILEISDSLKKGILNYLIISNLVRKSQGEHQGRPGISHDLTKSPEALNNYILGWEHKYKGRPAAAKKCFEKAFELDSSFYAASLAIETVSVGDEKYWRLTFNYNRSGLMDPFNKYFALWAYAYSFESPEKTLECLQLMEEVAGQTLFILGNKAGTLKDLTHQPLDVIPVVEKYFEIARKMGKEYLIRPGMYKILAGAYSSTGQYKKALRVLRKARKLCPEINYTTVEFPLFMSGYSYKLNRPAAGKRYFDEYIALGKEKFKATPIDNTEDKGWLYRIREMRDSADFYFRKALAMEAPNYNPQRLNRLTVLEKNSKHIPDLEWYIEKIDYLIGLAQKNNNKYGYFQFLSRKGLAYYRNGRYREALEIYQKVYDESPYKLYYMKQNLEEVRKAMAEKNVN